MRKLIIFTIVPSLAVMIFSGTSNTSLVSNLIYKLNLKTDSLNHYKSIFDSINDNETLKYKYVHNRFKLYNDKIDSVTVKTFIEVATTFKLDTNMYMFDMIIAQICVESGAKHRYKNGKLVVSSGNAIGITQIVPNSGYRFLKNVVKKDDRLYNELGGTYYGHIINKSRCKARNDVKKFLAIERNNIILWGYIMRYSLEKADGKLEDALLIYNQGEGFYRRFIKRKKNVTNFAYVSHIHNVNYKLLRSCK